MLGHLPFRRSEEILPSWARVLLTINELDSTDLKSYLITYLQNFEDHVPQKFSIVQYVMTVSELKSPYTLVMM